MRRRLHKILSAIGRWGFTIMIVPQRKSARRIAVPWVGVILLAAGVGILCYYPISVINNFKQSNSINNLTQQNARLRKENNSLKPALEQNKQAEDLLNQLKREQETTMAAFNNVRRKANGNLTSRGGGSTLRYESFKLPEPVKAPDGKVSLLETVQANTTVLVAETERLLTNATSLHEQLLAYSVQLDHTPNYWPVAGRLTSRFGYRRDPVTHGNESHPGIDLAVRMGTPVRAAADGIVEFSGNRGGYGNAVVLNHGYGYKTLYGHNSRLIVTVGQAVKKGQIIAYAGSSGKSTGPHVHFEVWIKGTKVNPFNTLR